MLRNHRLTLNQKLFDLFSIYFMLIFQGFQLSYVHMLIIVKICQKWEQGSIYLSIYFVILFYFQRGQGQDYGLYFQRGQGQDYGLYFQRGQGQDYGFYQQVDFQLLTYFLRSVVLQFVQQPVIKICFVILYRGVKVFFFWFRTRRWKFTFVFVMTKFAQCFYERSVYAYITSDPHVCMRDTRMFRNEGFYCFSSTCDAFLQQ
eukprot:TRINITY_DN1083_c0_g1_i6.p4 TRINITY_DN1083_c0_g1~~TRINITY_DN1083_c0_g1_i6.p4  ORF type:complete len:202 (-),score=-1.35 TRINITY_DN1083_c0_g1_i6:1363-1968(-)